MLITSTILIQNSDLLPEDKNIVPLEPAPSAVFLFYGIKFLSFANDKNMVTLPIWIIF